MNRRELLAGGMALAGLHVCAAGQPVTGTGRAATRRSFSPGEVWLDTSGKPIQAHAGSIIPLGDAFYSYGENKEFSTGKTDVWTWGVRCYR